MARKFGALTLAIVNDENSPAATASELVLPIGAGTEHSVAATKTVVLSMIAGRAAGGGARARRRSERRLANICRNDCPARSPATGRPGPSVPRAPPRPLSSGRGYGLGCVREIALKVSEILRVPALGYSAAELRHGPRASVTPATPVLVLRQNDPAAIAIDELVRDLNEARETVFAAGGAAGTLPWIGDGHPVCDPVVMLIPAYRAIEAVARRRGFDPDKPPHLSKVTRTL